MVDEGSLRDSISVWCGICLLQCVIDNDERWRRMLDQLASWTAVCSLFSRNWSRSRPPTAACRSSLMLNGYVLQYWQYFNSQLFVQYLAAFTSSTFTCSNFPSTLVIPPTAPSLPGTIYWFISFSYCCCQLSEHRTVCCILPRELSPHLRTFFVQIPMPFCFFYFVRYILVQIFNHSSKLLLQLLFCSPFWNV